MAAKSTAQRNAAASKGAASLLGGPSVAQRTAQASSNAANVLSGQHWTPAQVAAISAALQQQAALKQQAAQKQQALNAGRPPATTARAAAPGAQPGARSPQTAPTPFLTPAQQQALDAAGMKYGLNVEKINQALSAAQAKLTLDQGVLNHQHVVGTDNTNQALAARGLFQSSIRAGDLNDLDATFAMRNNILTTNYANAVLNGQNQLGLLGSDWTATQNYYHDLAVGNANGITPSPTAPAPAPHPSQPTTGGTGTGPMGSPGGPTTGQIAQAGAAQSSTGSHLLAGGQTPAQLGAQQSHVNNALLNGPKPPRPKSGGLGSGVPGANAAASAGAVGILGGIG